MRSGLVRGTENGTCSYCEGPLKESTVSTAFWGEQGMMVLEDVPARVCSACGEQFYDEDAISVIHRAVSEGVAGDIAIRWIKAPVYSFPELRKSQLEARDVETTPVKE